MQFKVFACFLLALFAASGVFGAGIGIGISYPPISSANQSGLAQQVFYTSEDVYSIGTFISCANMTDLSRVQFKNSDVFVWALPDRNDWRTAQQPLSLSNKAAGPITAHTDQSGNFSALLVWPAPTNVGQYDLVLTFQNDGFYSSSRPVTMGGSQVNCSDWVFGIDDAGFNVTAAPCSGTISLSLLPNPASPGTSVTATVSGLSGCAGKPILISNASCVNQAGQFDISHAIAIFQSGDTGGTTSFPAPQNLGNHTYCASAGDLNHNSAADANEYSTRTLAVQAAPTCGLSHPDLCTNQSSCTNASSNWCAGTGGSYTCQAAACAPVCDSSHKDLCITQTGCSGAGGNWCAVAGGSYACQTTACTSVCSTTNLGACATYSSCSDAGGYWCNGVCRATECVTCSANYCSACTARGACSDASCYWYGSACHAEQPPCTGSLVFVLDEESVAPGTRMTANVGGVSNCDGKQVVFKQDDCSGRQVGSCVLANNSCTAGFKAPKDEDEYSFVACLDRNNDGAFAGAEIATTGLTVRPATKVAGFPEWIFFLIISIAAAAAVGVVVFFKYKGKKKKAAATAQPAPELPF